MELFNYCVLTVVVYPSLCLCSTKPPNILLIVADDYGWNDIGYHGSDIQTPTLDKLASEGVKLENYYVQPLCSPSRSQLLSGRYQIHTGLQHEVIRPTQPNCLPIEIPTLADKLKSLGYATQMVGKWHLGMYKKECFPTYRGFDSFYGYLSAAEDYYTHSSCAPRSPEICGLDLYDNLNPVTDKNGTYSTHLFADRVEQIVHEHASRQKNQPLFMYVPFQSPHTPLQVPSEYMQQHTKHTNITNTNRRLYAGMVSAMDDAVDNITRAFINNDLWEDTLMIFTTDNGGQRNSGNNYPLKGEKGTLWEGGIRGVGFVHSRMFNKSGVVSNELIHISDWFPTILTLAGGQTEGLELDGYNVWNAISYGGTSGRHELLHNIDPLTELRGEPLYNDTFDTRIRAALRLDDWKILTGDPGVGYDDHVKVPIADSLMLSEECTNRYDAIDPYKNCETEITWKDKLANYQGCENDKYTTKIRDINIQSEKIKNVWLYNIKTDPNEYNDVSGEHPDIVKQLLDRLAYYNSTAVPCRYPPHDDAANPQYNGGVWGPWQ